MQFFMLVEKKMSHVLTTSKLYYGQFCKVKRILVCLQIEAIKLDETQPVNLNNFLTANLIVPHDFSKNSKPSPNVNWKKKQNNKISTKYKISIMKTLGENCLKPPCYSTFKSLIFLVSYTFVQGFFWISCQQLVLLSSLSLIQKKPHTKVQLSKKIRL